MKRTRQSSGLDRRGSGTSSEEGTKENPHQPPWIRRLQEILALVVFVGLAISIYNILMEVGERTPAAIKEAQSQLDNVQQSAQRRLDGETQDAQTKQTQSQNPASPAAVLVYARALNGAPGAIICQDYQAVALVFSLYNRRLEDRLQGAVTKGLSRSIRGEPAGEPDPAVFGCVIVLNGRSMMKEPGGMFPMVSAQLEDGKYVKGVTMPPMINDRKQ